MQVACEQDEDMVLLKNAMGLCVSVLGLLICLVYRNSLVFYQKTNEINDKIFDSDLITLGDFSVQGKVPLEVYSQFVRNNLTLEQKD